MKKGPLFLLILSGLIMSLGSTFILYVNKTFDIKEPWIIPTVSLIVVIIVGFLVLRKATSNKKR